MFALINGLTLHYRIEGPLHGPPLVFINSLGTDLRLWDAVVPAFVGRFRIIRFDKRGHGLSDAPPGPYTIRDHVQDLVGLLEHLKIETAILVGISVGGLIAMDYTLQHPQRVTALVLCDTAPKIGTAELWRERMAAVSEQGLGPLAEKLIERWFTPTFANQHPAAYRGYRNMLARMPFAGYIATCAALRDADLREQVAAITTPTLALCGAADISTPPAVLRQLAATLPNARFELISGAAHLPCVEQPVAVVAAVNRFFQDRAIHAAQRQHGK